MIFTCLFVVYSGDGERFYVSFGDCGRLVSAPGRGASFGFLPIVFGGVVRWRTRVPAGSDSTMARG